MWEYSHEGKQLENKWVFRRLQKTGKVCADVMSGGRLFQSRLPATRYHAMTAFSPKFEAGRPTVNTSTESGPGYSSAIGLGPPPQDGRCFFHFFH